jgi:hypothetical protein
MYNYFNVIVDCDRAMTSNIGSVPKLKPRKVNFNIL